METPERSQLAVERAMIFRNLCNGVAVAEVAKAFNRPTEDAVLADFQYVVTKIKTYLFMRAIPPVPCDGIEQCRQNKIALFSIMRKVNLDICSPFKRLETGSLQEALR